MTCDLFISLPFMARWPELTPIAIKEAGKCSLHVPGKISRVYY